jgi:hypothetical protein
MQDASTDAWFWRKARSQATVWPGGPSTGRVPRTCESGKFIEIAVRADNVHHPGYAEHAIAFVDHGSEFLDQRFEYVSHSGAICLGEHHAKATLDAFDLPDIKLPMSRPGNEAHDDDGL